VLATALWHERYVGEAAPRIMDRAREHRPALYVLTGDEIPFVQDGMRDGEHIRAAMQERFRDALAVSGVPWLEVRGSVAERVAQAVPAVEAAVAAHVSFGVPLEARSWEEQVALQAAGRGGPREERTACDGAR
jgi:nicotinamide riboside kinase